MAAGQMLLALDRLLGPSHELVLVGSATSADALAASTAIAHRFLPRSVIAARLADASGTPYHSPLMEELFVGRKSTSGEPVLYVCENFTCQEPAIGPAAIAGSLDKVN